MSKNTRFSGARIAWTAVFLLLTVFLCFSARADNLIRNPGFETVETDGIPEDWYTDAYIRDEGYSSFSRDDAVARSGEGSACIVNYDLNDARFVQIVDVEPETLYKLSGYVRTEEVQDGHGANLSVEGLYVFSNEVFGTRDDWTYLELYGETGEYQDEVTVFVRLGGYSGESVGKAWFDDICLEKVSEVPGSGIAALWFSDPDPDEEDTWDGEDEEDTETGSFRNALYFYALLYLLFMLALVRCSRKKDGTVRSVRGIPAVLAIGLAAAFLLRVFLAGRVPGYEVDINCFTSWGATLAHEGIAGFYQNTSFCDYPPAYMLIVGLNALVCDGLKVSYTSGTGQIVFRLIPSLCDILSALLIFRLAADRKTADDGRRTGKPDAFALTAALLTAFCPAMVLNTAAWGQIDSVLSFLLLLVVFFAIRRQWKIAIPVYVLAVLTKPQALMFGFMGLAALAVEMLRDRKRIRAVLTDALIGLMISAAAAAAIILPFSAGRSPMWLIDLYASTLSSYAYATVNAANHAFLFGGNWAAIETACGAWAFLLPALLCLACTGVRLFVRRDKKPEAFIPLPFAVYFIVGAIIGGSWNMLGVGAMVLAFAITLPAFLRKRDLKLLPLLGALLLLLLYTFGIKMHERYLFPAIFLFFMAWALLKDYRILLLAVFSGLLVFLNEGVILDNCLRFGSSGGHLLNDTRALNAVLSLASVLLSAAAVWVCESLCRGEKTEDALSLSFLPVRKLREERETEGSKSHHDPSLHWNRKDTVLILLLTAVCAVVGIVDLGSPRSPQNPWTSSAAEEQVVLDLGAEYADFNLLYFAQVSYRDFTVAVSADGEEWSEEYWAEMAQGQCWKWKYLVRSVSDSEGGRRYYSSTDSVIPLSGRYVRITARQIGLRLCEVILRTPDGTVLPAKVLSRNGGNPDNPLYCDPTALVDEQDTLLGLTNRFTDDGTWSVAQPSWYNSTYFDEIYHARTAYEMLNGTNPYETSHPPLGKLLMSVSVAIFGMTPFGWRFAGYLIGVLMIPAMYLLAKQLTKQTGAALFAALLMAADPMHFTQTRIATIDSFPVFFILVSLLFMVRFFQRDLIRAPMKELLPDLFLSGLTMGFSIASKWIGCYAGAGLAVIYFWRCLSAIREYDRLKKRGETPEVPGRSFLHLDPVRSRVLFLCCWCLLFFIAVPAVTYLLCYLPYFAYDREQIRSLGDYINRVIQSQVGMFNYHSTPGLGMDHPFYSPWYEWPVIGRPIYYASDEYMADSRFSYSIFCFGNPLIWFAAIPAFGFTVWKWLSGHRYAVGDSVFRWHADRRDGSAVWALVLIGLLSQFLPWALVPRGTYIYHYFASTPFLYLFLTLAFVTWRKKRPRAAVIAAAVFAGCAALLFCFYYPYASGMITPSGWMDFISAFPSELWHLKIYH